jgi:hypothetical protein
MEAGEAEEQGTGCVMSRVSKIPCCKSEWDDYGRLWIWLVLSYSY